MSSYIALTLKALDDGIFYQDHNEVVGNIVALKEFPKSIPLGGSPQALYTNTTYALIDDPVYVSLDGTNEAGATYELRGMGQVTAGDTGHLKLIRLDTSALVVEVTFTNTTLALVKSLSFTPVVGVTEYAVHVKATTGGVASPFLAYGFHLIQR